VKKITSISTSTYALIFSSLSLFLVGLCLSHTAIAKEIVHELTTASPGVVETVEVKVGDQVKTGQLLVGLDQRVYKAKLDEAVVALRGMKLQFDEAKKEQERAEELYERTVLSDHELSSAKIEFAKAESDLERSKREEVEARYDYDHSQLLAPFSGKVISLPAFVGMLVNNQLKNTVLVKMEKTR